MSLHGILLVDKPSGITSHDVIARMRRALGIKSIGHAGTLDPLATGLMVLLIGEATKISDYLLTGDKAYRVKIKFGLETDSLDITGNILKTYSIDLLELPRIQQVIEQMVGELELEVPRFSAIKVNGKKLVDKARKDLDFAVPTRKMKFYNLKIHTISKESVECSFKCSKGSYVRSWVSMIGQKLACGATVQELCRIYSAPYSLEKATPLVELEQMVAPIWKSPSFISLENCLSDWEAVTLSGRDEKLINNGQVPSSLAKRLIFQQKIANLENKKLGIRIFQASSGTLASLLELQPMQQPKIKRVFRY